VTRHSKNSSGEDRQYLGWPRNPLDLVAGDGVERGDATRVQKLGISQPTATCLGEKVREIECRPLGEGPEAAGDVGQERGGEVLELVTQGNAADTTSGDHLGEGELRDGELF
jgi:hypothetical protein